MNADELRNVEPITEAERHELGPLLAVVAERVPALAGLCEALQAQPLVELPADEAENALVVLGVEAIPVGAITVIGPEGARAYIGLRRPSPACNECHGSRMVTTERCTGCQATARWGRDAYFTHSRRNCPGGRYHDSAPCRCTMAALVPRRTSVAPRTPVELPEQPPKPWSPPRYHECGGVRRGYDIAPGSGEYRCRCYEL